MLIQGLIARNLTCFGCIVDAATTVDMDALLRDPPAGFDDVTSEADVIGFDAAKPEVGIACLNDPVVLNFVAVVDLEGVMAVEALLKVVPTFGFGEAMTPTEVFCLSLNEPVLKKIFIGFVTFIRTCQKHSSVRGAGFTSQRDLLHLLPFQTSSL